MNTAWKILSMESVDDLIVQARYFVSATDGNNTVETEGNWFFQEPKLTVPFNDVTESLVIDWIKKEAVRDGESMIEARLAEQLQSLQQQKTTVLPWLPQVFTPEI
jgi:hypothetical protein